MSYRFFSHSSHALWILYLVNSVGTYIHLFVSTYNFFVCMYTHTGDRWHVCVQVRSINHNKSTKIRTCLFFLLFLYRLLSYALFWLLKMKYYKLFKIVIVWLILNYVTKLNLTQCTRKKYALIHQRGVQHFLEFISYAPLICYAPRVSACYSIQ